MPEIELWSTLVTAIDPSNVKAMPAVLQSTIELLETELVKARAALQEIQPNAAATAIQRDELATGVMAAYRQQLIGRAPDFYGSRRLSPKEIGLAPVVQEVASDSDDNDDCVEQPQCTITVMPPPRKASLVHVLSNSLILDHMAPYLSVSSLLALASTSRFLRSMVLETPYVFRHLDLTRCLGAQIPGVAPSGAVNEARDDDESLTEDEFYAAPLRGIFDNLARRSILQDVRTLVLDGLSVPADLVADIMLTDRFNVNILSIRDCHHLNERKLMQILQYAVRPTRPQGTPRVKGIYHFTPIDNPNRAPVRPRYRDWWSSRSQTPSSTPPSMAEEPISETPAQSQQQNDWYLPSGPILKPSIDEEWANTIKKCEGIIAFDAVLCRGPRHNIDLFSSASQSGPPPEGRLLGPALATVALGPQGCDGCHTSPEGPAIWEQSNLEHFPLLSPIPHHSSSVTTAKRPVSCPGEQPTLIARCTDCLTSRWCHRCNKWFCSSCLPEPVRITANLSPHQTAVQGLRNNANGAGSEQELERGVSKDCWECGPTCMSCKIDVQRTCHNCRGDYCIEHNEGCSSHMCDWCNTSARHRLRGFH